MARQLGTLTLDLIAKTSGFVEGMTQAERSSDKWKKQVTKDAKLVGEAILASSAAAVAAGTAIVLSTAEAAKEIERLAFVSGVGAEEFQKYAAGAAALGVEQDKLADIFKDTSDKVGDFLQTGAGPLADFFENIAPKVGVTAEQFRNLSGPQALELYVSSLEKANLSQNEMTFFLEAIASDATLLLPLLKDNAQGFRTLGDQAEKAGAILDDKTLKASSELNAVFFLLEQSTQGLKNRFAADLIPVVGDLSEEFFKASNSTTQLTAITTTISFIMKGAAAAVVGLAGGLELLGKKAAGSFAVIATIPEGLEQVAKVAAAAEKDFDETAKKYADAINRIWEAGEGGDTNQLVSQIAEIQRATQSAAGAGQTSLDGKRATALEAELEALRDSFLTEEELIIEKYEKEQKLLEDSLNNKLLLQEEFWELEIGLAERREKDLTELQKREAQARLNATKGALGNLSTLMNTESRKLFEVGKAAALANAVISGYEAAVSSYAAGARIGGPPLGAAFAATAIAATAVQIDAIRSASFGGGSAGAGGSVTETINAASTEVEPAAAQPDRNVFVKGINKDDLFTGGQIVELLNTELENGGRLVIQND